MRTALTVPPRGDQLFQGFFGKVYSRGDDLVEKIIPYGGFKINERLVLEQLMRMFPDPLKALTFPSLVVPYSINEIPRSFFGMFEVPVFMPVSILMPRGHDNLANYLIPDQETKKIRLQENQIIGFIRRTSEAVHFLHNEKIAHGDLLRPNRRFHDAYENFILFGDGMPCLTDFSIAQPFANNWNWAMQKDRSELAKSCFQLTRHYSEHNDPEFASKETLEQIIKLGVEFISKSSNTTPREFGQNVLSVLEA